MQKDGRILYDPDTEEIGRMLFDDPLYKPYPQLPRPWQKNLQRKNRFGQL
jgi:hypothetical protein